jgi:hypothetical protein
LAAFALIEYGRKRVTVDVDVLRREDDLQEFKRRHLGKGYAERVPGTGKLYDTKRGVNVDVLSAGRFRATRSRSRSRFPIRQEWLYAASASHYCRCRAT